MRDVNFEIRKAYYSIITGLGYDVFYQQAPQTLNSDSYIILSSLTSNDTSTKNTNDLDFSMQVKIYTKSYKGNSGVDADTIAGNILNAIMPTPQFNITLSDTTLQVVNTILQSDIVQDYSDNSGVIYIDRFITFKHKIFQQ